MVSTRSKCLKQSFYFGVKLGLSDGKIIAALLVNVDVTTLGIDVGTELKYLYGSFNGSNYDNIKRLLLEGLLESNDGKTGI